MPVGLAPTPRSLFEHAAIDYVALEAAPIFELPFNPGATLRGYDALNQPTCQIIVEDWMPGGPEFTWVFTHDEYQIGISGAADIEVHLPPLYSEAQKAELRAGSLYIFPVGARMKVRVLGNEPYRHICFCPPSPGYPFPKLADIRGSKA
jgi:mannose-6-phosphate isomerase-like protein (cupin superfamily)